MADRRNVTDIPCLGADYDAEECALLRAIDEFRREGGKQFVLPSEVLGILRGLGYVRLDTEAVEALRSLNLLRSGAGQRLYLQEEVDDQVREALAARKTQPRHKRYRPRLR